MKFSAYMFIRNGMRAGYTFMEAIENVLPFVDEFFILDGKSDDGTLEALEAYSKLNSKIRIESKTPEYVAAPKDERGVLLGAAFDEAREKCDGDWLIQVQADTVFHPITVLAARDLLLSKGLDWGYDAIEIVRNQYRWNWQEMYREDRLALIFRKKSGKVFGDALNIKINGKISRRLLPLFSKFPAADNAWVFFENILGKIEGCFEIWGGLKDDVSEGNSTWYNSVTRRDFKEDLDAYRSKGVLPPFWEEKTSPFAKRIPVNLLPLLCSKKYEIATRFFKADGNYSPKPGELEEMRVKVQKIRGTLLHRIDCVFRETVHYAARCLAGTSARAGERK